MVYVSSSCINKNRIGDVINQLAQSGIRNIELSGGTEYYDGLVYDLIRQSEKYQLKYTCHAYFPPSKVPFVVNLASCNDEIYKQSLEHYDNCLELLKKIDCNVLSVHSGFMVEIHKNEIGKKISNVIVYDKNESYSRFCYAYQRLLKKCNKQGVTLYLENNVLSRENYDVFGYNNYFMMIDYETIMYMKKQIEFDLLLDLGHLYVSANTLGLDYGKECKQLKEYVKWIHISENNGISDEHKSLRTGSKILEEFCNIYDSGMNVTLEAIGDITDILKSIKMLGSI